MKRRPFRGLPWAVDAVAVALAGADAADKAVPDEGGALAQLDAVGLLAGSSKRQTWTRVACSE